ncbi:MAG: lysophospholipid acyltransferase family protein [Acidimicrobiales bacterium]
MSRLFCRFDLPARPAELDEGTALMCANHRSLFDLILAYILLGSWGVPTRFLVNGKYFDTFGLGWLLRVTGCIPVESGRGDDAIDEGIAILADQGSVAIMPEGRLIPADERHDGVGPIRMGVGRLAVACPVPVMVVGVAGTDRVWPRSGVPRPRLRRPTVAVRVRVLSDLPGAADDARDAIVDTMTDLVAEAEAAAASPR